jgi:hypothetical protein
MSAVPLSEDEPTKCHRIENDARDPKRSDLLSCRNFRVLALQLHDSLTSGI